MRALSVRQASRCETAFGDTCHCRCNGRFHGARRILDAGDRALFEELPEDDPHHIASAEEKKRRAKIRRALAKRPGQGQLFPLYEEADA